MAQGDQRRPVLLSEVLADLFAARGYSRFQAVSELDQAWETTVGEPVCHQTRVSGLRRGVLSVTVAHPVLHQELSAFHKPVLLAALRRALPSMAIHDIRFRVGPIESESQSSATPKHSAAPGPSPSARVNAVRSARTTPPSQLSRDGKAEPEPEANANADSDSGGTVGAAKPKRRRR